MKRLLKKWNLNRRTSWSPPGDVFKAIKEELTGSGQQLGYKFMWQRLKMKFGLQVKRDVVLQMMHLIDSDWLEEKREGFIEDGIIVLVPILFGISMDMIN